MSHKVADHPELIGSSSFGVGKHCVQGRQIAMHVGKDSCSHALHNRPVAISLAYDHPSDEQ